MRARSRTIEAQSVEEFVHKAIDAITEDAKKRQAPSRPLYIKNKAKSCPVRPIFPSLDSISEDEELDQEFESRNMLLMKSELSDMDFFCKKNMMDFPPEKFGEALLEKMTLQNQN
jgi:hypothetical protein